MFLEKNNSMVQQVTPGKNTTIQNLMRHFVEHECKQSRRFTKHHDLEREIQNRMTKLFS